MIDYGSLSTAIYWYQKKIGSYDKQLWEKTIEERVLRGLSDAIPKKVARVKTELIDLDLIRGSTFAKAKPQQSWLATTYLGIIRVVLFPFYCKWWTEQTNPLICSLMFILLCLQIASMHVYFFDDNSDLNRLPMSEVLTPVFMFFVISSLQSQMASSHSTKSSNHQYRHHLKSSSPPTPISGTGKQYINMIRRRKRMQKHMNNQSLEEDNLIKAGSRVEPLIPQPSPKKGSDEESGLDSIDANDVNESDHGCHACQGNTIPKIEIEERSSQSGLSCNGSGMEAEDDNSPYSTVNSEANYSFRRYSDLLAEKLAEKQQRSSQSRLRRYSMSDETLASKGEKDSVLRRSEGVASSRNLLNSETPTETKPNISSLHLSPPSVKSSRCRHLLNHQSGQFGNSRPNYSSYESEGSISPTTPIKGATSDLDWPLINSDGTSDEEIDEDDDINLEVDEPKTGKSMASSDYFVFNSDMDSVPPAFLNYGHDVPGQRQDSSKGQVNDKVSCAIWQHNECQKIDLTVLDISSAIIRKVRAVNHSNEYLCLGCVVSFIMALLPALFRLLNGGTTVGGTQPLQSSSESTSTLLPTSANNSSVEIIDLLQNLTALDADFLVDSVVGSNWTTRFIAIVAIVERFCLSMFYFFLLCVAERTYRERFLYAKYFCHLTSSRRARRSELPHFRLNKVRNIKSWLSIRSYLKKHGPQRSVDIIVSSSFILAVCILTFLCLQLLKESSICSDKLYSWEIICWNLAIGVYIMRLIILGSKMNKKYRGNLSVLIAEQINLYLQLEQKPHKKEELTLANHVLKLACDLLKQLESPFKISGFNANPYLYNITKVVVLSAFSAVLTELLGFKLKLYKIKL